MKRIILILSVLYTIALSGQSKIDSLKATLNMSIKDSSKVKLLNKLGIAYLYVSTDTSLLFTQDALKMASEHNFVEQRAKSFSTLISAYRLLGDYPKSIESGFKALQLYKQIDDQLGVAKTLNNMGNVYYRLNELETALTYFNECLEIQKREKNLVGEANVYIGLGIVYKKKKQFNLALENYVKALSVSRRLDLKLKTSICLENIGNLYIQQNQYDKALPYLTESLAISEALQDKQGIASISRHLADLYQKKGALEKSIEYANHSLDLASKNKLKTEAAAASFILSESYHQRRDFEKALVFFKLHKLYRDSLYNESSLKEIGKIESTYEIQQKEQQLKIKEQQIGLLERDKQLSTLWRNILIGGLLMIFLISFFAFKFFKERHQKDKIRITAQAEYSEELESLNASKSRFFGNISHEFRTPLTLIKGPIEHLEQNPEERLSIHNIKMIRRNINRVLNLVNQLLDLSKIDRGRLKLNPTEGDIYKLLRGISSSFNSHAAQRRIDYKLEIPNTVLWATFDRDKLEKIVYNLLSNAFKFSDDDSEISLKVSHTKTDVIINVLDRGKGIPKDQLPFIFDRFYQIDDSSKRRHEGSGIGLSLSKDLVELMDGTITASSEVDKGSLFTVHLPIKEIKTRENDVVDQQEVFDANSSKKELFEFSKTDKRNLPTVLIVEDNADMRHFIKERLLSFYRINEAFDGEEGLQMATTNMPDLVISDLMMPVMDGIEFCKALKANIHTSHIPVIMLTAKAGMKNKIEGLEIGADDYLTKPFDVNELLVRIKNLIEQRQKLRELYSNTSVHIDPKKITLTSVDQRFLEEVLALLEDKFSEADFGVPQMQQLLGMSKTQLHRKLKALTNEAPGELLRNFRLKRAAHMILQKSDSVTQIAYQVGFNNPAYFTKCFKEVYKVTPSSYKAPIE